MPSLRDLGTDSLRGGAQASVDVPVGVQPGNLSAQQGPVRRSARNQSKPQVPAGATSVASAAATTATIPSSAASVVSTSRPDLPAAASSIVHKVVGSARRSARLGHSANTVDATPTAVFESQPVALAMPTSVTHSAQSVQVTDREVYYQLGPLFADVQGVVDNSSAKSSATSTTVGNPTIPSGSVNKDSNADGADGDPGDAIVNNTSISLMSPKKRTQVRFVYEFIHPYI
jgi:hypothetical protein